jgi:hypothetical protein
LVLCIVSAEIPPEHFSTKRAGSAASYEFVRCYTIDKRTMASLKRFISFAFVFCLIVPGSGLNCQDQNRGSEQQPNMDRENAFTVKPKPLKDFTERPEAADQELGRKTCINDDDCEEGFSCWYKIPRGPSAGIPGSKEKPGKCWSKDEIHRIF